MSMNLFASIRGAGVDIGYQTPTGVSYRLVYEDWHWVEKHRIKSLSELRRSTPARCLNKYHDWLCKQYPLPKNADHKQRQSRGWWLESVKHEVERLRALLPLGLEFYVG